MNKVRAQSIGAIAPGDFANRLWAKPKRSYVLVFGALAGMVFVALISLILFGRARMLVLDHPSRHFIYPFTIQNLMHVVFFVGLADLSVRWRIRTRAINFLSGAFCPRTTRRCSSRGARWR